MAAGAGGTPRPEPAAIEFTAIALSQAPEGPVNETILGDATITLPPLGSIEHPPDAWLEAIIPSGSPFPPSPPELVTGVVRRLNPQPLPPSGFAATMEVFTPGTDGTPTNVRVIRFWPADPCDASELSDPFKSSSRTRALCRGHIEAKQA